MDLELLPPKPPEARTVLSQEEITKLQEIREAQAGGGVFGWNRDSFISWVEENVTKIVERSGVKAAMNGITERLFNWGRRNSPFPLHLGIMCCAIEMAASADPRWDTERFGIVYRSSPRQCDILLLNGPVSLKLVPSIQRLWEQMPEPKWSIAMGECVICGGPYWDSYAVVEGADRIIPIDIYVPGCPVRPDALIDGFLTLQGKIKSQRKGAFFQR